LGGGGGRRERELLQQACLVGGRCREPRAARNCPPWWPGARRTDLAAVAAVPCRQGHVRTRCAGSSRRLSGGGAHAHCCRCGGGCCDISWSAAPRRRAQPGKPCRRVEPADPPRGLALGCCAPGAALAAAAACCVAELDRGVDVRVAAAPILAGQLLAHSRRRWLCGCSWTLHSPSCRARRFRPAGERGGGLHAWGGACQV